MAVYKQPKSKYWWYKFTWNREPIRESTKQTNMRVAEQMEAAHRTALAKGEVGIRERKAVPTVAQFAERDFRSFVESRFVDKRKTLEYYRNGLKNLLAHDSLARERMDAITDDKVGAYVTKRRAAGLQVTSINRELAVLRRMQKLAVEWRKVEKVLPRISMIPGERHRERVITADEEKSYFEAATCDKMQQHLEPQLLHHVVTILLDCALRPEECFRLRWEEVRESSIHVLHGKTENARRVIPLTPRVEAILDMRKATAKSEWIFPRSTRTGHIEKSSLRKQHAKASKLAGVESFPFYTFRHTCLTRWAAYMDPYTLGYLAGHGDFATTKRYVHPQAHTVREAMERARVASVGHTSGHTNEKAAESAMRSAAAIQ